MKKILILGAGLLQSFVIKKAKELGYYTITVDKNPNSIGFKYADEYSIIDIVDQKACLKYAIEKKIDGVLTAATDYGVLSAAYIAKQMNLPGLDYEVARVIKNKYRVRYTLLKNKIDDMSQCYEINNIDQLKEIKEQIRFPVIVKPCDGSGSKAVRRVDFFNDLEYACKEAIKVSLIGSSLIEDFIEGKEYGVESFVYNGEIHILGVLGKYMTPPPDYAELGHYMPSQLPIEEKVKQVVNNAIRTLNINFGAVNMDLLVTKEQRIYIVDVGARMGGNLIGSHIIPIGTGIDYMGNLIKASVGEIIDFTPKDDKVNVATRLLTLRPGKIVNLPDLERIKTSLEVNIFQCLHIGDTIREYHNNLDGCGYILSKADDVEEAKRRAERAKELIDLGIVRG